MGLIERLFGTPASVTPAFPDPPEAPFGRAAPAQQLVTPPAPPPTPVPYLSGSTIAGLSAVVRCVNLIADTVSGFPWQEWTGDRQLAPSRLVRRPMALMSRREWVWRVVATEALYSTCYLLHVGGTDAEGAPWSLLPVPPGAIVPANATDPWGLVEPSEYIIGGQRVSSSFVTVVRRSPWPGVPDHLAGILNLARREFQSYLAADIAAARYWMAGGPITTVISTEQALSDPQAAELAARWVARRTLGADYPAVLGRGGSAQPWGADPTAESAVEARREMVADVGRYFGVPTRILNAPAGDSETYSNVELDGIDLLRYTLQGYIDPMEEAISEILPGDPLMGRRMRVDPSRIMQGPLPERATAYVALVSGDRPLMTVAEARVRGFGLSPEPSAAATAPAAPSDSPAVTVTTTQGA